MRIYTVVLLDDEHLALNLLENFCQRLPDLQVKARFRAPEQALDFLHCENIDILFSDIQMPLLNGLTLLRSLPHPPVTIFTTAYAEHAVTAYELNVIDYLLKPFSFERFAQAVGKARMHLQKNTSQMPHTTAPTSLICKVDGRLEKIPFDDIEVVEGMREYVKIICRRRHYITLESMKRMEEILPNDAFVRTHKSYIVAKRCVQNLDGHLLTLEKMKVPVSRERKDAVIKAIFGPEL